MSASGSRSEAHWIYVKAKNDVIRRVEISAAKVAYADDVPREQRKQPVTAALQPGAEIRVTASQDANGEWHASRIEITAGVADAPSAQSPAQSDDNNNTDDSNSEGTYPENLRVI
jgi:hypothetical protein